MCGGILQPHRDVVCNSQPEGLTVVLCVMYILYICYITTDKQQTFYVEQHLSRFCSQERSPSATDEES